MTMAVVVVMLVEAQTNYLIQVPKMLFLSSVPTSLLVGGKVGAYLLLILR